MQRTLEAVVPEWRHTRHINQRSNLFILGYGFYCRVAPDKP